MVHLRSSNGKNYHYTISGPLTIKEKSVLLSAVDKLLFQAQLSHEKIKQKILGLEGKPQSIIIVASWRTGSTFLAQLVASGLKNMRFFIYEPLLAKVILRKKLFHRNDFTEHFCTKIT